MIKAIHLFSAELPPSPYGRPDYVGVGLQFGTKNTLHRKEVFTASGSLKKNTEVLLPTLTACIFNTVSGGPFSNCRGGPFSNCR